MFSIRKKIEAFARTEIVKMQDCTKIRISLNLRVLCVLVVAFIFKTQQNNLSNCIIDDTNVG